MLVVADDPRQDFVALDDALNALAPFDERKSRVVELRFFGGLSVEETASALRWARIPSCVTGGWRRPGCSWRCAPVRMTPERWKQLEDFYHSAYARRLAIGPRFSAPPRTTPLRREVESLLDESDSPEAFLRRAR